MGTLVNLRRLRKACRAVTPPWLERWQEWRVLHSAAKNAPVVLQDNFDIRFILYPWARPHAHILLNRTTDTAPSKAMSLLIRPGDVVFDVGAHIGRYSVLAHRLSGAEGMVFSFEPVPDTFWMLRETLALNRCCNVTAVPRALCDEVGSVTINLFELKHSSWNTLGLPTMSTPDRKQVCPSTSMVVPSDTIDHFCGTEGIDRINFLKVDVEGFEKSVFAGAGRYLRERRIDYICFEVSQAPLEGAGVTAREVFQVLEAHGYSIWQFNEASSTFVGPVHDSSEYWANYYASWLDLSILRLAL
jgi:FkbM family methyltransferase